MNAAGASRAHRYSAYGLTLDADLSLPGLGELTAEGRGDVRLDCDQCDADAWVTTNEAPLWRAVVDGRPVTLERRRDGAFRMTFGADASFRLSSALDRISCEPAAAARPEPWQRFLLDTVLGHVALGRGMLALHAAAVEVDGRAVAIVSNTGGGKTTLAYELLTAGARLLADDVCVLSRSCAQQTTHVRVESAPGVMNLAPDHYEDRLPSARVLWRDRDEMWLEVERATGRSAPLALVLMLQRRPGSATGIVRLAEPLLELSAFALGGERVPASYKRRRFEALADVATTVPVTRLHADVGTEPAALAERALCALGDAESQAAQAPAR